MKVALMFSNDELAEQLANAISEYTPHTADRYTATVYHESRADKIQRMKDIASRDYDLIQTDELIGNGPFGTVLATVKGVPVAGYLRGWGDYTNGHEQYGPLQTWKIRQKSRFCIRNMDGMAAISHAVIAGVRNQYRTNGIDVLERPYNVEYYGSGTNGVFQNPTVLTVTNLRYAEKAEGVKTIIDGLSERLQDTDLQYAVAGDGRQFDDVESYVDSHPASDSVQLLGYRDDIADLLASADLFAYVSFLDGRPSTVYEAQAAGLPIVAGDAAGVPEAVGDAGEIVPPTARGIKRGVSHVLDDAALRKRLERASTDKMARHNERVAQDWGTFWEGVNDRD